MKNIFITLLSFTFIVCAPTKKVYGVDGMMCGVGCVNKISSILKTLEGVHEFSVDYENQKMEVVFDNEDLSNEKVIASLPRPYQAAFLKETETKEYMVEGMTCFGCVNSIESSINELEGLELYDIKLKEGMLFIEYDINKIDSNTIISKIPSKFKVIEILSLDLKSDDVEVN